MKKESGILEANRISIFTLLFTAFLLFFLYGVSADIFLVSQPDKIYSVGDTMNINLGSDGTKGWAGVDLVCNNQTKMIYFNYIQDSSSKNIAVPFTNDFLGSMIGNCHLSLTFNSVEKSSFDFEISNKINVFTQFSGTSFKPGETIVFSGTAEKPDTYYVSGSADIKFQGIDLELIIPINNDKFSGNLTIPDNIAAGQYAVTVSAYEKDSYGNIMNSGEYNLDITVLQKPAKLAISAPTDVVPGNEMNFKADLYDQTGQKITDGLVAFKIIDLNGKEVYSTMSDLGADNNILLEKNAPFGYWKLSADANEIVSEMQFYVEKHMGAVFEMNNGTLTVRNVGNVLYNKTVEIRIGNETVIRHFELEAGKSVQFDLSAPEGEYDIGINDGQSTINWPKIHLTGDAVSVDNSSKGALGFFNRYIVAWVFIIAILGLFIFLSSKQIINRSTFLSSDSSGKYKPRTDNYKEPVKKTENKTAVMNVAPVAGSKMPVFESSDGSAIFSTVIDGVKQSASIVALRIKNSSELRQSGSNAYENINNALKEITETRGKIYRNNDFIIGIFAPNATRTFDNELTAVKVARNLSNKLKQHNDKFKQKISFGIGVNSGEIVTKTEAGKFYFSALGNTLTNAKKIAEMCDNNVLLSEGVNKKVIPKVKTSLIEKFGTRAYSITEIVDRQQNDKFIETFLQRNQEHKALRDYRMNKLDSETNKTEKKSDSLVDW